MANGIQGITPLEPAYIGFQDNHPEASAEDRNGGPVDPRHAVIGERAKPYPWERFPDETHGPYGIESELLGDGFFLNPAGTLNQDPTADLQPITHAAHWPKALPQTVDPADTADARAQSAQIHSANAGGSREMQAIPTGEPLNDSWQEIYTVEPGTSQQVKVPKQIAVSGVGGWGSRDRVQSLAGQNQYGFDSAHMHRRIATGSIPGNHQMITGGSRPFRKTAAGLQTAVPNGQDSPFHGQDGTLGYDTQGSALATIPTAYTPPPDPMLAPAPAPNDSDAAPEISWY